MNRDKARTPAKSEVKTFYMDGSGEGPDGCGSGWAWVYVNRDKQQIERVDGLTSNEAEYRALIGVLQYVGRGSSVLIFTDSALVSNQFAGKFRVNEPRLKRLLDEAKMLMEERNLEVEVRWIPRERNLAGKLLDRT
jgi:ribonuclease HI